MAARLVAGHWEGDHIKGPTNENINGLVREYLPKGLDLAPISQGYLNAIARQLNNRPRKCLNFETPAEVFAREIMNFQPIAFYTTHPAFPA